ncbi:MAG: hypothetical protein H6714_00465 [Myxococcales bacterium]|nr:hypothetical protein [Myxococcales bacterium]
MRLKTLLLAILVCIGACSDDESHFLNCGEGVHLAQGKRSYCMYSASIVASQGDAFACPEGTLTRINIDGAAVCTNVPDVNLVSELPPEVCSTLQTEGCVGESGNQLSITLSNPGAWSEDVTKYLVPLFWVREAPNPDAAYFYGTGSLDRDQLNIEVPRRLPEMALQDGIYGVGQIAVVDPSYAIPQGEFEDSENGKFLAVLRGWALNYAIVFKQDPADYSDETKQLIEENPESYNAGWFQQFDIGYSCGRCVRAEEGSGRFFDSYEPVACEEIVIEPVDNPDSIDGCNWT